VRIIKGRLSVNFPRTEYDALPLPTGRTVGETASADLVRILSAAGVDGVNAENGRHVNIAHFARHIACVKEQGAMTALAAWLAQHRSAK
jgi:hypothetical protein